MCEKSYARMGYTRIEHLAGGAASFAALWNMTRI